MAVIGVRSHGEAVSQLILQGYCLQALCKAFAHVLSHPRDLVISAEIFCRWERGPQVQSACVPSLQHEVCLALSGHSKSVSWKQEWALVLSISSLLCSVILIINFLLPDTLRHQCVPGPLFVCLKKIRLYFFINSMTKIFVLIEIDSSKCIHENVIMCIPHVLTQLKCHPLTQETPALAPCALCILDNRTWCRTCHQVSITSVAANPAQARTKGRG